MELNKVADEYFLTRKDNSTTISDRKIFTIYILPYFKKDIHTISREDIVSWTRILNQLKLRKINRKLSTKYKNDILSLLRTINKFALQNEFTNNDFRKYIIRDKVDNTRERFLNKEDINYLYEYVKDDDTIYLFIKLGLNTGARLSSILNLKKHDIDFTNKLITIKDFKNNSTYKVPLSCNFSKFLYYMTDDLSLYDKLFVKNPTRRIRYLLHNLFNQHLDVNDNKNKVVIHTFRHTFASHLALNETPIYNIQALLNHKDIKMTMRYAKLNPSYNTVYIEKLNF